MSQESRKCLVKQSDMSEEMQQTVCDIAIAGFAKFQSEGEVARFIKKEMDSNYGPIWHVVVGKSFASFVSHEQGSIIYFYVNNIALLVFKSQNLD